MPGTRRLLDFVLQRSAVAGNCLRVRTLHPAEIDQSARARWRELAARSMHHNPFLLPEFVLPAWKHLTPYDDHVLVVVERERDGRWMAAGGFCLSEVTSAFPLPHALASSNQFTYRTGLLVDSDHAPAALDLLLRSLTNGGWGFQGVEFPGLRMDSILTRELQASTRRLGFAWQTTRERQVPVVFPGVVSEDYLAEKWSKSRRKSMRRGRNRLEAIGPVTFHLARTPDEVARALKNFLRLEVDSWKGEQGTACASNPRDNAFITEAITGLARHGNVVLSELRAGDRVAACAINLVAGTGLYAFKIGWDTELADASPGVLHESELLLESQKRLSDYTIFDSCATECSYIAPIWPERITVATGLICASRVSKWSQSVLNVGRIVASWC